MTYFRIKEGGWKVWGDAETIRWTDNAQKVLEPAMKHVKKFDLAIDVGANIGIFTWLLAEKFAKVVAFEPYPPNIEAFRHNQAEKFPQKRVIFHEIALSDRGGRTNISEGSGINAYLIPGDAIGVETLDAFGYEPDLLKIDAEGYDLKVLRGALETIRRCWPVIIVENKPLDRHPEWYKAGEIQAFLEGLGYMQKFERAPDQVWIKQ